MWRIKAIGPILGKIIREPINFNSYSSGVHEETYRWLVIHHHLPSGCCAVGRLYGYIDRYLNYPFFIIFITAEGGGAGIGSKFSSEWTELIQNSHNSRAVIISGQQYK